jgi:hypothetical protein
MGLAQMLLTIAAIALLGTITLTLNSSYLASNQTMVESEFTIEAVSFAESYLERAVGKSFDEKSIYAEITKATDLSTPGKDAGETKLADFDDFDDFHNYISNDSTVRSVYNVRIFVTYVNETKPDVNLSGSSKSFHKKMTIQVLNSFMSTPVVMNHVFSYFGGPGSGGSGDDDDDDDD